MFHQKPLLGKLPLWTPNPAGIPAPKLAYVMNKSLSDLSLNGNDGINHGADWVPDGLNFVAVNNDYVDTGNPIHNLTEFTMVVLAKTNTISADNKILGGTGVIDWPVIMWLDYSAGATGWSFGVKGSSDQTSVGTSTNNGKLGVFQTVTGTWDGNKVSIFVDGVLADSASGQTDINESSNFYIGRFLTGYFDGIVAYVYLYDRALTPTQIVYLHQHPYYAWEYPEIWELYAAAAGGVTMPIFMSNYLRQMGA